MRAFAGSDGDAHGSDEEHVVLLAGGLLASHALHVVATLGIADLLGDTPRSVEEIAADISVHPYPLQSIFRLLAGHGLFVEASPGWFTLTARGALLRTDHPRTMRSIVRLYGFSSPAVLETEYALRTGRPSFDKVFGQSFFGYLQSHPNDAMMFDDAMADLSRYEGEAILGSYDFARFQRIVDVGGGDGTLLRAILAANPARTGVVFDQPDVAGRAEQTRETADLGERLEIVGGDFFAEVPSNGDLYVLKSVLHDWPDDRATKILRACRQAMAPSGRLVVFERMLVPGKTTVSKAATLDLLMILLFNGRERTQQDYSSLFANSGFTLGEVVETGTGIGMFAIEGIPV